VTFHSVRHGVVGVGDRHVDVDADDRGEYVQVTDPAELLDAVVRARRSPSTPTLGEGLVTTFLSASTVGHRLCRACVPSSLCIAMQ
jgi:hypothetical protein